MTTVEKEAPTQEFTHDQGDERVPKGSTNIIRKTSAYHQFKYLESNRKLNERHVQELVDSITRKNLLEDNPIIVNQNMDVLDGQYRLEAASRLGVPIYYKVSTKMDEEDIAAFNSTASNWKLGDYLDHYVAKGLEDYIQLKEFCEEHKLLPYNGIGLLSGNSAQPGGKEIKAFEHGEFRVLDLAHAERIVRYVDEFNEFMPYARSKAFLNAIVRVSKLPSYNHEEMLRKAKQNLENFTIKYNDVRSWLNVLESVYNKRRPAGEAVNFRVA